MTVVKSQYMVIINYADITLNPKKHPVCQLGIIAYTLYSVSLIFTTLYHSNTLVKIGEVVEKLLAPNYHHDQTINQLKHSA